MICGDRLTATADPGPGLFAASSNRRRSFPRPPLSGSRYGAARSFARTRPGQLAGPATITGAAPSFFVEEEA